MTFRTLMLAACGMFCGCVELVEGRYACTANDECPSGWYCVAERCVSTGGDAGPGDSGPGDAGPGDAAPDSSVDASPDSPCTPRVRPLDVLVVVDNSGTMQEEQAKLIESLPRMVEALALGAALPGRVFPAADSINIGVATTFMPVGAGDGFGGCRDLDQAGGYDGMLTTELRAGGAAGCAGALPAHLEFRSARLSDVMRDLSCKLDVGIRGCGFEQPLEAMLKALSDDPSLSFHISPIEGHGRGANRGFLREGSVLLVLLVTDERDGSASDLSLFDPENASLEGTIATRTARNDALLYPTMRYVDGLIAAAEAPERVVFATLAGVPDDLATASPDTILADPRMTLEFVEVGPATGMEEVRPACLTTSGRADPATRALEVAAELEARGAHSVFGSICADDFDPFFERIVVEVAPLVHVCEQ